MYQIQILVTSYTGIQSTGNVESLVVLEPLMSSQAYSAVALKVKIKCKY